MSEPVRPRVVERLLVGAAVGLLTGLLVKDLRLTHAVSFWGDRSQLALVAAVLFAVAWQTRLRPLLAASAAAITLVWLVVAFTPVTDWAARPLPRRDRLERADAILVLASNLQEDGDLSDESTSRLLHGLRLLGEGWAPRLILTEHVAYQVTYRDKACELMDAFGMSHEIVQVRGVRNTHDEAVGAASVMRDFGLERLIVVTSPSHSRRAASAVEAQGVRAISSPSPQTRFDYENLSEPFDGDDHVRAFGSLLHEYLGIAVYRMRGWIE